MYYVLAYALLALQPASGHHRDGNEIAIPPSGSRSLAALRQRAQGGRGPKSGRARRGRAFASPLRFVLSPPVDVVHEVGGVQLQVRSYQDRVCDLRGRAEQLNTKLLGDLEAAPEE